jgi:hypothetical protein
LAAWLSAAEIERYLTEGWLTHGYSIAIEQDLSGKEIHYKDSTSASARAGLCLIELPVRQNLEYHR